MRPTSVALFTCLALGSLSLLAVSGATTASAEESADFTRFVAVGDSLTAGYADGTLFDGQSPGAPAQMEFEGQRQGFAVRLALSMETPATLPLIPYPGLPGTFLLQHVEGVSEFGPDAFTVIPGTAAGRSDPTAVATVLGVPGQSLAAALTTRWTIEVDDVSTVDSLEDLLLGLPYAFAGGTPKSQIETAVGLAPTFVSVWLGNNDALGAATSGDADLLTSVESFEADAETLFATLAETGAGGAVANIPDVTVLPYFISRQELRSLVSRALGRPVGMREIRTLLGVRKGDLVTRTPQTLQVDLPAILSGAAAGPLPAGDVLDRDEVRAVRKATKRYNRILARAAKANGWAFVDIGKVLRRIAKHGVRIGDRRLSNAYLGGVSGMDGIHPTSTGHGIIATAFVEAINRKYGTQLPTPDLEAIVATDPLAQGGR